jgi:hypothetical protein
MKTWIVLALLCASGCDKGSDEAPAAATTKSDAKALAEAPAADLPAAETLLAKAADAIGGAQKLAAIKSFHYTGKVTIPSQKIGGSVEHWWKDGDFYGEQQLAGVGRVRVGKQGDVIWSEDPILGLRRLEGAEMEQYAWAASIRLVADWKLYFPKATTVGERELAGKKVYDVELESPLGEKVTMTFEADSGLQVAQKFSQVSKFGKTPVEVALEDYREVDGIKIAFRQVTDAKVTKLEQTIDTIELGGDVDTSKFAMPTGGAEVVALPPK